MTPDSKVMRRRSPGQRIELIQKWSKWFYERRETFTGELALQLAYLWPAIANEHVISASKSSEIVQVLEEFRVPKHSEIWDYIVIEE